MEAVNEESYMKPLTGAKILTLVLYFIESEYHFTGNGVWPDEYNQSVDQVNNSSLPYSSYDRVYNYGIKSPVPENELELSNTMSTIGRSG